MYVWYYICRLAKDFVKEISKYASAHFPRSASHRIASEAHNKSIQWPQTPYYWSTQIEMTRYSLHLHTWKTGLLGILILLTLFWLIRALLHNICYYINCYSVCWFKKSGLSQLWRNATGRLSSSRHRSEAKVPVNRESLRARGALDQSGATDEWARSSLVRLGIWIVPVVMDSVVCSSSACLPVRQGR